MEQNNYRLTRELGVREGSTGNHDNVIIFSTLSIIFESIHMCSLQYRRFQEQLKIDIIFKGTTQNLS